MLWLLVLIPLLVLGVAPLRRAFLTAWRFTFPAALGFLGGAVLSAFLVGFGVPALVMLILPPLLALQMGAFGKAWFDQNFGPSKDQKP
jgi:hypothetical protein